MTRIKICGLTRPEDVDAAVAAGVDFLGFNLWRKSPRYLHPRDVARLIARTPATVISVGVFVHGQADELVAAQLADVDWVQIHGTPPAWTNARISRTTVRALAVDRALSAADLAGGDFWILDRAQAAHGGGGKRFDAALAKGLAGHARVFVAGGLDPDNVGEVIRLLKPYAVDVASGCESAPGVKDRGKLRAFVDAVREADRAIGKEGQGSS